MLEVDRDAGAAAMVASDWVATADLVVLGAMALRCYRQGRPLTPEAVHQLLIERRGDEWCGDEWRGDDQASADRHPVRDRTRHGAPVG